ncbi:DUF320 domain-containing protein [Streptomyces sp. SID4946]|nr:MULTISPECIES: chaplin [unclassified Streptomyces]MYQ91168.1 DUF320 domain-containing protein [Streptomyces sp. SID4946]
MRQTLSKGMVVAAAAATGVLSLYGTAALADSNAQSLAQGSPGVLSGNSIQVPVHVPVNVCGNSVDVAALLNPAFGNSCANVGHSVTPRPTGYGNDAYGHDDPTPPVSYGKPDPTPTPTSYGHDDPTPPAYGSPSRRRPHVVRQRRAHPDPHVVRQRRAHPDPHLLRERRAHAAVLLRERRAHAAVLLRERRADPAVLLRQ